MTSQSGYHEFELDVVINPFIQAMGSKGKYKDLIFADCEFGKRGEFLDTPHNKAVAEQFHALREFLPVPDNYRPKADPIESLIGVAGSVRPKIGEKLTTAAKVMNQLS